MHILLLGPDWQITARFRREIVADMLAAGWRVTIAAAGARNGFDKAFLGLGADCVGLPSNRNTVAPAADLKLVFAVAALCRRIRPDAVLAFSVKPVTFGLIGALLGGARVRIGAITGVGYSMMDGQELKRRLLRVCVQALYRIALSGAQRVIFQNEDDTADFRRQGLIRPSIAITRTNGSGVDLAHFTVTPLPDAPLSFLMIARLLREKGVFEFVEAARRVKAAHPQARFVLVGPMDSNPTAISPEELQSVVDEGIIEYAGPQADVRPYLAAAHIFVLPSYREGTPRSALEALATGRPILTVDVPGCREVVVDGVTGRLVQARSAKAVAEGMCWFIERNNQLREMSIRARQDAEARFDVRVVNRVIMSALLEDARGRSPADAAEPAGRV